MRLAERFRKNLLKLRTAQGLSQSALAEKAGFSLSYVGALERGEREPSLATVEVFAQTFAIEPHVMLLEVAP